MLPNLLENKYFSKIRSKYDLYKDALYIIKYHRKDVDNSSRYIKGLKSIRKRWKLEKRPRHNCIEKSNINYGCNSCEWNNKKRKIY